MDAMILFPAVALVILLYVSLWYLYGERKHRLDVADEAWGLAQPLIVITAMLLTGNYSLAAVILLLLTTIWGGRLFWHLRRRHASAAADDRRYAEMKAKWQKYPRLQAYLYVFILQGLFAYLLGLASMVLVANGKFWEPLSAVGILFWLAGFVMESVSDRQLRSFVKKSENKGKIMDQGLFRYSRHPNYFGEIMMWWGIYLYVLLNTGYWWTIISPLLITYLIVFVSGIPLAEKGFKGNPAWEKYKSRTSILIPWFPKG